MDLRVDAAPAPPEQPATLVAEEPVAAEVEEVEEAERYPRNVFLERTTLGLGALIGAAVTVPVVGFAVAPTFIGQGDKDIDLGPIVELPGG